MQQENNEVICHMTCGSFLIPPSTHTGPDKTAHAEHHHHYDQTHRQLVAYHSKVLQHTTMVIAKNLDMSLHVVQCILSLHEEIGWVARDPESYAKQGRAHLLDHASCDVSSYLLSVMPH